MKKNIASQTIGAQMVSATDGSAFTGSVTVYVTKDGGTQAVGSVGSGACTHEGNGYHSYSPAQAETNADHIAWTFIGSGAVPATVQVYTSFPQTGDAFATATNIETDTQDIQSRIPASLVSGRIDASVGAMAADVVTASAIADNAIDAGAIASNAITAAKIATGAVDADALAADALTAIADALLKRDMSAVTGESARSPLNAFRLLRNKWTSSGGTLTVTKEDDSTTAWTAALTSDASANPITVSDPA